MKIRNWAATSLAVVIAIGVANAAVAGDGLSEKQRDEVGNIVEQKLQGVHGKLEGIEAVLQKLASNRPTGPPSDRGPQQHHPRGPLPGHHPGVPGSDFDRVVGDALRDQEAREQRHEVGNVLKTLIGEASGSGDCKVGYGSHGPGYRNHDGSLNFGAVIQDELHRQELCRQRQRVGEALKALTSEAGYTSTSARATVVEPACYYYPVLPVCR